MNFQFEKIISSPRKIFIIFLLVGLAAYAIVLPTQFKTMDDLVSILNNPRIHHVNKIGEIFRTSYFMEKSYYRPMVLVTYMAEYQFFGLKSFFYNLDNVLLHILNAFIVYLIIGGIWNNKKLSFISAFFYLIHPVHWEAVSNIPGRSIILCALFFLYGFWRYMCFQDQQGSPLNYVLTVISFILALLSKESAIVLPVCLMSYLFIIKKRVKLKDYSHLWPFFVIIVLYLMLRRGLGINAVTFWESPAELLLGVATFLKACVHYCGQIILPVHFYYDHTTLLFTNFTNATLWAVVIFWTAIILGGILIRKKLPAAFKFFAVWIVINFITMAQIVPIRAPGGRISTTDHFLYVPVIGAIVLLVWVVNELLERYISLSPSIKKFLVGGYGLFLFMILLQQNFYATNQIAMFRRTLENDPYNHRVRNSLAICYAFAGEYEQAEYYYRQTLKYDPHNTKALIGSGKALADQGKFMEALGQYQQVKDPAAFEGAYKQNLVYVYNKLIEKYYKEGKIREADSLNKYLILINTTNH